MAEQAELDLPAVPSLAAPNPATRPRLGFGGFTRSQMAAGLLLFIAVLWSLWVTKAIIAPHRERIVSVRLSELISKYVDAQRYSGSPPAQVQAEMKAFLASLDKEIQRRSAGGDVVVLSEAIVSKNVVDITEDVRKAAYSSVPEPKQASAEQLQRMQRMAEMQALSGQAGASQAPAATPPGPAFAMPQPPASSASAPYSASGATVSTFGGPDGVGGE